MLSQNAFAYCDAKSDWATGAAVVFPLHAPSSGTIDKLVINKVPNAVISRFMFRFTAASVGARPLYTIRAERALRGAPRFFGCFVNTASRLQGHRVRGSRLR